MKECSRCGKKAEQCEERPTNCIWEGGKYDPRHTVHKKVAVNKSWGRRSYYYDVHTACNKTFLAIEGHRFSERWAKVKCKRCIKKKARV